ncbi:oxidoreductase [Phyllobacterium phragmitis]|uniref:Oxidoreductase n=1 Tax=Phyllobacterium phragmitis TaxID=2670329 RepID=A0A2S9IK28_9HYPH|nr:aldo/keto reductase [Phyllobacterium phragmitis]PRD40884.1 oxidoreductase [Phyllobacterium phragmitis]
MERIDLAPGLNFSRLVCGMWRLADGDDTSPASVQAKVEACLQQGITTMDHADIYGGYAVEGLFGAMLKTAPSLRDRIEIITKCDIVAPVGRYASARVKHYDTTAAHIIASVETSLEEMAIDHIDLLLIHRPDPLMNPDETGSALDALVKSGKVRSVGVSNFRPWDFSLLQSSMEETLVTNQIEMSLIAPQAFTNGDLAFLQERMIAPMAWSPLGGGSLFDGSRPELVAALKRIGKEQNVDETAVAIAWLLRHPARILPVVGTNNLDRIVRIGDAAKIELDRQAWFELYTLAIGKEVP